MPKKTKLQQSHKKPLKGSTAENVLFGIKDINNNSPSLL